MRRITGKNASKADLAAMRFLPKPALLKKRLAMTGKSWTVGQYGTATVGIALVVGTLLWLKGLPLVLALLVGVALGAGIPHLVVGHFIKRRVKQFNAKFPDAIELLVRGLRSGLPIAETIGVVGQEVPGPVGIEFRSITDKMKIGRTNLAEVLRKRSAMKLKIKAMSSESKASAYIIGSLPFIVFALIMWISPAYMGTFFVDQRLIVAGGGGMVWMGIGAFIMAKMISFEI